MTVVTAAPRLPAVLPRPGATPARRSPDLSAPPVPLVMPYCPYCPYCFAARAALAPEPLGPVPRR
ncbi:hypothetical protein MTQ01_02860 [Streptomyces sp. XM4193]|uniref:hypothetical protein n=1 Tax=Streptomyces sp. XM4193 TaxID=2929782 RepID=UPI001FFB5709|nr:hypothetical protein [Streptomyces sp. XM4193]MCK1794979.1 hypothetical protein [Streptomyces sp. XM4193]